MIISAVERITYPLYILVGLAVEHPHVVLRHLVSACHVPGRVHINQQLLSRQYHSHIVRSASIVVILTLSFVFILIPDAPHKAIAEQLEPRNHSAGCCCSLDSHSMN